MQDPLTQILNHGAIIDTLLREIDRAHREHKPLSLILADLDGFKNVNDSYGHVAGDRILVEVASRMRNCLRSYDAIGRYGGEEFLIVLPNSEAAQAVRMAERIRLAVSQEPFRYGNVDLTVTVSQGVTTWTEPCPIPIERLIRSADGALYLVKNSGRNGVEFARFDVHAEDNFSPLTTFPTTSKQ
jgi:diguanylate cyclase (GGDEF)-like protein